MKTVMKQSLFTLLLAAGLCFSLAAHAMDLKTARDQGLVGELRSGFVAIIKPADGVSMMVEEVNSKRLIEYRKIAAENKQSVDVVATLAAGQIINKLSKGHYYQTVDHKWAQK